MSTHLSPQSKRSADDVSLSAAELFDLFGDEYTRRVYHVITDQPRSGRAVAEAAGVSRATAYRRLNELQDADLVRTETMICDDGHHKERFEAVTTSLSISLDDGLMADGAD